MSNLNCSCKTECTGLAVIASIIIGVITAFLTFTATITITPAFLWVTLGISVVYLAVTLLATTLLRRFGVRDCVCRILPTLLTGILGTALASLILLGVEFAATSIVGAIIAGILLLFLTLTLTTTACLAKCIAGCPDTADIEC